MNYFNGTHLTFGTFCWISVTQSKLFFLVRCRRTISMETGCQNIQLCATILKVAFSPEVIGPLYLFPLIYIVFQGGEALVFILLFRCYEAFKPKIEGKCHSWTYCAIMFFLILTISSVKQASSTPHLSKVLLLIHLLFCLFACTEKTVHPNVNVNMEEIKTYWRSLRLDLPGWSAAERCVQCDQWRVEDKQPPPFVSFTSGSNMTRICVTCLETLLFSMHKWNFYIETIWRLLN